MKIGIDGSRAFLSQRTGIEEYSYQVIKNLMDKIEKNHQVVLYIRKNQKVDLKMPSNWKIKIIKWPYFWTQIGLSLEMLFYPVDTLFIPAHTVPFLHAKNTIVTIHGLEYEFCPQAYSFWERIYMRWLIKFSCRWAQTIISVSQNTKSDLIKLYKIEKDKVRVIYEGYDRNFQFSISNPAYRQASFQSNSIFQNLNLKIDSKFKIQNSKFILFIGRLEERKNIKGIIEAFEILKEKYKIPHKLILAGKPGYGYNKIKFKIQNSKFEIYELGYVNETQKWQLLLGAEAFIFPSLCEGFGLPILEAQSAGVPVVASIEASIPEVVKNCHPELDSGSNEKIDSGSKAGMTGISALLVNPNNPKEIAEATYKLISDENLRKEIVEKGYQNVKRFSWDKCAEEIARILNR